MVKGGVRTIWIGVWKAIMIGLDSFEKGVRFKVGDGASICVWEDVLCGDKAPKEDFPLLFSLVVDKGAWVGDVMVEGDSLRWDSLFEREFNY